MNRRLVALLLAVMLITGCANLPSAYAQEPSTQGAIFQLEAAANHVTVSWYGQDVARVVVKAYDDAGETLLEGSNAAVSSASQGNQQTVCTFSSALPFDSGFVLQGWLADKNGTRISDVFEERDYTSEIQALLTQSPADFVGQQVLMLDETMYGADSFVVLKDGVTLIEEKGSLSITPSDGNNGYWLTGVDTSLLTTLNSLPAGAMVCIVDNSAIYGVKMDNVQINGNRALLKSSGERLSLEEYSYASTFKEISKQFQVPFSYDNFDYTVSGTLNLELTLSFYSKGSTVKLDLIADYLMSQTHVTLKSATIGHSFPLMTIPLAGLPFMADFEADLALEISGNASASVVCDMSGRFGVEMSGSILEAVDIKNISEAPQISYDGIEVEGEIYLGLGFEPAITLLKVISASLTACGGCIMTGKLDSVPYSDQQQKCHACEDFHCLYGDFTLRVFGSANISCGIFSKSIGWNVYETPPLADWYYSFTFMDGGMTVCPHRGYRLRVNVKDANGASISGAAVEYAPAATHYESHSFGKTNDSGFVDVYIPLTPTAVADQFNPTDVTVKAEIEDSEGHHFIKIVPFQEKGYLPNTSTLETPEITLTIDNRMHHVYFKDSNPDSGSASGIPADISYYNDTTTQLRIPDQIPEKTGRLFVGWSTNPQDENAPYKPGSAANFQDDTTLYAIWKLRPNNSYYIIYNANGGDNPPQVGVYNVDEDAFIPREVPTRAGWTFVGWNTEPNGDAGTRYLPGDAYLKYRTITLYAIWQINSFSVFSVSFDINGDPTIVPPATQWGKDGDWLRLNKVVPQWDPQHQFLGWSPNKRAALPNFFPGLSYLFADDTQLFAVWKIEYHMLSGNGSVWILGNTESLRFVADGNRKYFSNVQLDGRQLEPSFYTVTSDGTTIDLSPSYLNELSLGNHTLQICFQDGATEIVNFSVSNPPPATGDDSAVEIWLLLLLVTGAGAFLTWKRRKADANITAK